MHGAPGHSGHLIQATPEMRNRRTQSKVGEAGGASRTPSEAQGRWCSLSRLHGLSYWPQAGARQSSLASVPLRGVTPALRASERVRGCL